MSLKKVKVKITTKDDTITVPQYKTENSSGFDFEAAEDISILPNTTTLVPTGIFVEFPPSYELQIRPRSGVSLKTLARIPNSPGTIDSDYRGEVKIIVQNTGKVVFNVAKGDRIAQGVLCPVVQAEFEIADSLSSTARGDGGFGHTGVQNN